MCKKRPSQRFRQYDQWAVTPVSEYRGLSDADRDWLEKFNTEYTAANASPQPTFTQEQRRESYRSRYHRRHDALLQARYEIKDLQHDPTPGMERLIDKYRFVQRRIKSRPKK